MAEKRKRIKNPNPVETPVQVFKRIKAQARVRPIVVSEPVEAGSPGPADALPAGSETPKAAKKAAAKKTAAKKSAAKK